MASGVSSMMRSTPEAITVSCFDPVRREVVVGINDQSSLNQLIKKLKTVKGVKDVQRS